MTSLQTELLTTLCLLFGFALSGIAYLIVSEILALRNRRDRLKNDPFYRKCDAGVGRVMWPH